MRARTKLAIPSLIALLLMALSPAVALGESPSEIVYPRPDKHESHVPGVTTLPPGPAEQGDEPSEGEPSPETVEPGTAETVQPGGPAVATPAGERHTGEGHGDRRPATSTRHAISDLRPVNQVAALTSGADPVGNASDDGGTSPILLVLIAVAALAVLSAGVAFFNDRRRPRRR